VAASELNRASCVEWRERKGEGVSNRARWIIAVIASVAFSVVAAACSPEVGSEAWCKKMKETSKADWSTNDAAAFAKNCVLQ
jgi:hypothetical protein